MEEIAAKILPRVSAGAVCFPPNLPACARLRAALAKSAPGQKLPPVITFRQLSAAVRVLPDANPEQILKAAQLGDPDPPAEDDSLEIYAALRETAARPPAADLRLAALHAQFFREMSERNLKLPATESETLARVAAADTPAARAALSEITAQLFKLWRDFYAPENSPAAKHRRALARVADNWKRPLFAVGPATEREPMEVAFCERIQNRGGECFHLPPPDSLAATFARNALSGSEKTTGGETATDPQTLREHFAAYREGGAASLHDAAALALSAVAGFATDGAKHIGVVVFDRVLARRMNAMALARGRRVADLGGWRADTLAFGAALRMMTDAGADSFSPDSFSEILRAPPLFAGQNFSREQADAEWRRVLQNDLRLPTRYDEFSNAPDSLREAAKTLSGLREKFSGRRAAAEWLDLICAEADSGILREWRGEDAAADRVMTLLSRARESARDETAKLDAHEFRAWLSRILEAPIRIDEEGGGVFFLSPVGAVMRKFDAMILLGGGADYLPGAPPSSPLSERERRALGLPSRGETLARHRERFCGWIGECEKIALIWRGAGGKEDVPPSPYWELLKDELRRVGVLKGGENFPEPRRLADDVAAAGIAPPRPARARVASLPAKISATGGDRLLECPYVFFARDILGLESDDAEPAPSAALMGSLAHEALARFAESETDETNAEKIRIRLDKILAEFARRGNRPGFRLTLERWRARLPLFAEWESRRRLSGWRTIGREKILRLPLSLAEGSEILLSGRIDRVDANGAALAIVDYKTGRVPLQWELDFGEFSQLPLYAAMLSEAENKNQEGNEQGGGDDEFPEWLLCRPFPGRGEKAEIFPKSGGRESGPESRRRFASEVLSRFKKTLSQIASGADIPASGLPSVCARCPSRPLCRRDHWTTE